MTNRLTARLQKMIDGQTHCCSVTTTQCRDTGKWGYMVRTYIAELPQRNTTTTWVGSQEDATKELQAIIKAKLDDNYSYAKVQF